MAHLIVDDNVVFGRHVIGDVVVDDETKQSVEKRQIDLLVHLLKVRLQHDVTLPFTGVPHVLQVVDTCNDERELIEIDKLVAQL